VNEPIALCRFCGRFASDVAEVKNKWMHSSNPDGSFDTTICPDCYSLKKVGDDGQVQIDIKYGNLQKELPLMGSFRPVKTKTQLIENRADATPNQDWWEAEKAMIAMLVNLQQPLFELRFSVLGYDRLSIEFHRENGELSGLTVTGDIPKKGQFLTVYQKARLRRMGFAEMGDTETSWKLSLRNLETSPANVARVTTHVVQFGLLLDINDASAMTPYVDTEATSAQ
jgi:hypothetical protein